MRKKKYFFNVHPYFKWYTCIRGDCLETETYDYSDHCARCRCNVGWFDLVYGVFNATFNNISVIS